MGEVPGVRAMKEGGAQTEGKGGEMMLYGEEGRRSGDICAGTSGCGPLWEGQRSGKCFPGQEACVGFDVSFKVDLSLEKMRLGLGGIRETAAWGPGEEGASTNQQLLAKRTVGQVKPSVGPRRGLCEQSIVQID